MLNLKPVWCLMGVIFFCLGCDLMISQEDVKQSVYTVMRGFEISTKDIEPEVSNLYINKVDLRFATTDETLVNEMTVQRNNDLSYAVSGICFFSGYRDPYSGYSVEGELAFECETPKDENTTCLFSCDTDMNGGKVKTLEFELDINADGTIAVAAVIANGKQVKFNKWDYMAKILRAFQPSTAF